MNVGECTYEQVPCIQPESDIQHNDTNDVINVTECQRLCDVTENCWGIRYGIAQWCRLYITRDPFLEHTHCLPGPHVYIRRCFEGKRNLNVRTVLKALPTIPSNEIYHTYLVAQIHIFNLCQCLQITSHYNSNKTEGCYMGYLLYE